MIHLARTTSTTVHAEGGDASRGKSIVVPTDDFRKPHFYRRLIGGHFLLADSDMAS